MSNRTLRNLFAFVTLVFSTTNTSAQNYGYSIFDDSYLHSIEINFYDTINYWDTLQANYDELYDGNGDLIIGADKKYYPAQIIIDGNALDSAGIRLKGYFSNWGANSQKKPFKVDLNEFVSGQRYDGLNKFNLGNAFNDPTMMRDKLSLDLMRDAGMVAARCTHTKVYINGEYWGLYNIIEQYNDDFLAMNFGEDTIGNLYKNMNNSNMEWEGSSPTAYQDQFEKKTNEAEDDWTDFVHLMDVMNNTPQNNFKDSIDANMDMHVFFTCLAVDRYINNWDSYMDHGRNWYMYNDPHKGKFVWLPWDYNLSFADNNFSMIPQSGGWFQDPKPIIDNSMDDQDLKNQYMSIVCTVMHNVVDVDSMNAKIDSLANMIRQAVYDDTKKETTNSEFDTNIDSNIGGGWQVTPGLKPLISSRKTTFLQALQSEGFGCNVGIEEQAELYISLYPNPSDGNINLDLAGDFSGNLDVTVVNMEGRVISQTTAGQGTQQINLSQHAKGVYFLQLTGDKINRVEKLVIY